MTADSERLFEQLDPPPGGAERLRARLAAQRSSARHARLPNADSYRRRPLLWLVGVGVAAMLVLAVVSRLPLDSALREPAEPATAARQSRAETQEPAADSPEAAADAASRSGSVIDAPEFDRLLGRSPAPVELSVTVDGEEADLVPVSGSDPQVRVYLFAGTRDD